MLPKWYRVMKKSGFVDKRQIWRERLSLLYLISCTGVFGCVVHGWYNGKLDWVEYYGLKTEEEKNESSVHFWTRKLNIENAKYYKITGFSKIDEVTDEYQKEEIKDKIGK